MPIPHGHLTYYYYNSKMFGSDKAADNLLHKIEQIIAEKTQGISTIEETLQWLAAHLSQPPGSEEIEKLLRELDQAEKESLSLREENLNLRKLIRELRRGGASPACPLPSAEETDLYTQLEHYQQELCARSSEIAQLNEALEQQAINNDTYIETLNAQITTLRQQIDEAQNSTPGDEERILVQTQQLAESLNAQVAELQQQLAEALADKEAYAGQVDQLAKVQQVADSLNLRVDELQQQLAEALADKELYAAQVNQLTENQLVTDSLNAHIEELQQQIAAAHAASSADKNNISMLTAQLEQKSTDIEHLRQETTQLQQQLNNTRAQEKQLAEQLQHTQNNLSDRSAEAATLTSQLSAAATDTAALRSENTSLTEQLETKQEEIKTFREMQMRFFPNCLLIPDLEPFIEDWRNQFTSKDPDYRVLSMFSYLFSWSCLMESLRKTEDSHNSNVEKEAISAIAYFSRYLLDALYAKGVSADEAQHISLKLIEQFNRVLSSVGTKHQLFVPFLGESYDTKTMTPDASRGNTFGVVEALFSWGVHNPETEISYSKCQVQLV